jgi:hypothetical protein
LRQRFADNGIRGLFGRPYRDGDSLRRAVSALSDLVQQSMRTRKDRDVPFLQALEILDEQTGDDADQRGAVDMLREFNQHGAFDEVSFEQVWSLLQAAAKAD